MTDRALLLRWLVVVTLGEVAGFVVPAVAGAVTAERAFAVSYPALLAAGAVEGAVLGLAQWSVLRHRIPALDRGRWTVATAAGAVAAYAVAMPATASGLPWLLAPAGVLVLLSIGVAQALVLRGHLARAWRWVAVTATAWLLALAVFMTVATPLWRPGQPLPLTVAIGLGAGLLMALTMAAVTGWGAVRLTRG